MNYNNKVTVPIYDSNTEDYVMQQIGPKRISFYVKEEEIVSFEENGDIMVKGRLAENDKELVNAFREMVKSWSEIKNKS